ncbi:MAG: SpoIID/LytB domain-containing protein [Armatimonadetes bacterium]|nr:SpoIID/LytB domain-containing protein [Armatimonadota bacterium]
MRVILLYRHRPGRVELSTINSSFVCTTPDGQTSLLRQGERWIVELADGGWRILRPGTGSFGPKGAGDYARFTAQGPWGKIIIKCLEGQSGEPAVAVSRGDLLLSSGARGLLLMDEIGLEAYLSGVLPEEISARFPEEALRVQCIVSRTFALSERGRHGKEGADFCDNSHCQVYGAGDRYPSLDGALQATRGQVLTYKGALARVFYHSSCGGHTLSAGALWRTDLDLPYLKGVSDQERGKPFCREASNSRWTRVISSDELSSLMGWNEEIQDIQVVKGDRRDRRSVVVLAGNRGSRRIPLYEFWTRIVDALGWGSLGSPWFQVTRQGRRFCFSGRGLGHGVGLCQWGARGMAKAGYGAEKILEHYFPETRVGRVK